MMLPPHAVAEILELFNFQLATVRLWSCTPNHMGIKNVCMLEATEDRAPTWSIKSFRTHQASAGVIRCRDPTIVRSVWLKQDPLLPCLVTKKRTEIKEDECKVQKSRLVTVAEKNDKSKDLWTSVEIVKEESECWCLQSWHVVTSHKKKEQKKKTEEEREQTHRESSPIWI